MYTRTRAHKIHTYTYTDARTHIHTDARTQTHIQAKSLTCSCRDDFNAHANMHTYAHPARDIDHERGTHA